MLEHTHVAGLLADDRSDLAHVESAEHAEQDHLSLISRQARTDQRDGGISAEHVDRRDRRVVVGRALDEVLRRYGDATPTAFAPSPVDETVPCDREHPRAELRVVTAKARQISSSGEPGVGFDIFRCHRVESSQEPQ